MIKTKFLIKLTDFENKQKKNSSKVSSITDLTTASRAILRKINRFEKNNKLQRFKSHNAEIDIEEYKEIIIATINKDK